MKQMKATFVSLLFICIISLAASAQTTQPATGESKTKVKPTTTVPQKVHNVIHPHHKEYSGVKAKHKESTK